VLMPLASMASRTPIIVRRDYVWGMSCGCQWIP
jgi:hypothetical protein